MKLPTDTPPGFVAIPLKGAVLVIPERVYVAGLQLGKMLRRREAHTQRLPTAGSSDGKTFVSEAKRLMREFGLATDTVPAIGAPCSRCGAYEIANSSAGEPHGNGEGCAPTYQA